MTKVIAIVEYDSPFPIAVVAIPKGVDADWTFVLWYCEKYHKGNSEALEPDEVQDILELPYCYEELEVQILPV